MRRNYYRMDNGGMSQDSGTNQQQQIIQEVAQALQQGAQPEQVAQQLVQMGIPQDQAVQVIQAVAEQLQGGGGQAAQPQMSYGGPTRQNSTYSAGVSYQQGGYIPSYEIGRAHV